MDNRIDFVVLWVDSGDPKWQEMYTNFTGKPVAEESNRYRDWGMLKYWFRAVEKYAPWVNNIYFVTCGQKPDFLNEDHPKLKMISHTDFIEREYLPTFNSNVIELNLMNIKDLSEHFVLFNDDIFLNSPVTEEDFFVNGLPCDCAILDMILPLGENDFFYHAILNNIDIINKNYDKKSVVSKNSKAWYKLKYGEGLIRNILLTPWKHFSGFKDYHLANSYLKSSFRTVYQKEKEAFHRTYNNHFRNWNDITHYLVRYYQLCEGLFYPKKKNGRYFAIGKDTEAIVQAVSEDKYKLICLNDNSEDIDFESNKKVIIEAFEKKYPEKSAFEK